MPRIFGLGNLLRERLERVRAKWIQKHGRPPTRRELERAIEVDRIHERAALVEQEVREEERAASADAVEHALAEDRRRRGSAGGRKRADRRAEALVATYDRLIDDDGVSEDRARELLRGSARANGYSRPDAAMRALDRELARRKKVTP